MARGQRDAVRVGLSAGDATGAVGASIMDWDYRVEYNQTYTLDAQHALTPRTSLEVSFLASRTVGADSATVRNVSVRDGRSVQSPPRCTATAAIVPTMTIGAGSPAPPSTIAAETLNELADFEQIPWDYGDCSYLDLQDFSIDEDVANRSDDRTTN